MSLFSPDLNDLQIDWVQNIMDYDNIFNYSHLIKWIYWWFWTFRKEKVPVISDFDSESIKILEKISEANKEQVWSLWQGYNDLKEIIFLENFQLRSVWTCDKQDGCDSHSSAQQNKVSQVREKTT